MATRKRPKKSVAKKKSAAKKKSPAKKKSAAKKKSVAKKGAPKKKSAAKPQKKKRAAPPKRKPRVRRDATGHLDPSYARDLRRASRENAEHDDDRAFLVGKRRDDALAQELGTEFVETVTSGEDEGVELRDEAVTEELGGPFVPSTAGKEFADEPDESNPEGATREPFPKS
jgi:hypothetical protein